MKALLHIRRHMFCPHSVCALAVLAQDKVMDEVIRTAMMEEVRIIQRLAHWHVSPPFA